MAKKGAKLHTTYQRGVIYARYSSHAQRDCSIEQQIDAAMDYATRNGIQIIRIFIYPMRAHTATVMVQDAPVAVMGDGQFIRLVLYLVLSAVCLIAGAIVGVIRSRALSAHLATLDTKAA